MKCPGCGNVLTQEEAFCGQCGTSTTIAPMGNQPAYTMIGTPSPHTGLLGTGVTSHTPPSFNNYKYGSGALPPEQAPHPNMAPATQFGSPSAPLPPANPRMQTGFYHEATDVMAPVQPNPSSSLVLGYPQQSFPGTAMPTNYSGMAPFAPQANPSSYAFQAGNYAGPMPTQYPPEVAQGYNYSPPGRPPQAPQKHSSHLVILVVCIVLAVILVGAMGITAFALTNHSSSKQATTEPAPTAVSTVAPMPTSIPSPTPAPSPTPPPLSTPAPDAGFSWCGTSCNQYGFSTEFPAGWTGAPPTSSLGFQFSNPAQPSVYAAFKTPGTATTTGDVVLMSDVQTTFGSQPGYAAPTSPTSPTATIGGASWYAVVTTYNDAQNQPIRVEVYATVYQGKSYIIELQAPNAQFDAIKQQSFVNMLVKFQFVSSAQ